jgi:hypothetical protein
MTIVRVGLAENKKFAAGFQAIFGAKTKTTAKKAVKKATKVRNGKHRRAGTA